MLQKPTLNPYESWVSIPNGDALLEGILSIPNPKSRDLFVLCHPHPQHEGTMHNKVITTMVKAARALGANTLRFNYRGVCGSAGRYEKIDDAVADANSVLKWVCDQALQPVGWMGFSFGAYIAAFMANQTLPAKGALLVAPSVDNMPYQTLTPNPTIPWHMMQSHDDEVVSASAAFTWAEAYPYVHITHHQDGGHFFHGKLSYVQQAASSFIEGQAS